MTALDLSHLWAWLVVALGAGAVDPRRRFGSAAAVVLAVYVAFAQAFAPFVPRT